MHKAEIYITKANCVETLPSNALPSNASVVHEHQ